jgi:hypothetical protein
MSHDPNKRTMEPSPIRPMNQKKTSNGSGKPTKARDGIKWRNDLLQQKIA